MLKFSPSLSPAQELATRTIGVLTFGLVPENVGLALLATLECAIGLGLISDRFMRLTLILLAFQMIGAASPHFLFPGETFAEFPYALTLEGQYIVKNVVLVSAGVVIGATVRGGGLTAHSVADESSGDREVRRMVAKITGVAALRDRCRVQTFACNLFQDLHVLNVYPAALQLDGSGLLEHK